MRRCFYQRLYSKAEYHFGPPLAASAGHGTLLPQNGPFGADESDDAAELRACRPRLELPFGHSTS